MMRENMLDQQLIEEYSLIQQVYSQDNEILLQENQALIYKLKKANDSISDKDNQIRDLMRELDEIKRLGFLVYLFTDKMRT